MSKKKKKKSKHTTQKNQTKVVDAEIIDSDIESESSSAPSTLPAVTTSKSLKTSDPLIRYLEEIRKYPLLTPDEERKLAIRYKEKQDPIAAEKLVTANLRFVVKIAAEYAKFGTKMLDLIQEGNVGLMHAIKEFNPYKDVRLITYAVWWIRGYIREYLLKNHSLVKMGTTQNQKKLYYNLQKEIQAIEAGGQRSTPQLISERLGVPVKDVKVMQKRLSGKDVSLDQPLDSESQTRLIDLQSSDLEEGVDEQIGLYQEVRKLKQKVEEIKPGLNKKELFILENRTLSDEPQTLQEIGDHFGITRERTRQLENRVIKKIKEAFQEDE